MTFNDLCAEVQKTHGRSCNCSRPISGVFISTKEWSERWLTSADHPDLSETSPAVLNGEVVSQVENSPGEDRFRSLFFSFSRDMHPGCVPLELVNDRVWVPNVSSNRIRLPSPTDLTFSALQDACFIDKTRFIKVLSSRRGCIETILRPPGYGKSTFLHMMADIHDLRPGGHTTIPQSILALPLRPLPFERSSGMVLLLDLGMLDMDHLADSVDRYLAESVHAFAKKYHPELHYDAEGLLSAPGSYALSIVGAAVREKKYKLFLGIDNYSAPYEHTPEAEWEEVTRILNTRLYSGVVNLLCNGRLAHGLFVGNFDAAMQASTEALKRTFGYPFEPTIADEYDLFAALLAFTGWVQKYTVDSSYDLEDFQDILGMTNEDIGTLGDLVLGDQGGAQLLQAVQDIAVPRCFMSDHMIDDNYPAILTYSFRDVLDRVRHLLGRPNDDMIFFDRHR